MRKKIKLIFLSLGLSIVLIAGIIELGKILNVVSTQETSQGFKEMIQATLPPKGLQFVAGSISGADCSAMYSFVPGAYCARHEWEIARHVHYDASSTVISDLAGPGRSQEVTYEYLKTVEMAQSMAYAQYFTVNGNWTRDYEMQRIVWGSWQFKQYTGGDSGLVEDVAEQGTWTTASDGMKGRSYQFANFVYKALDEEGHLGLTFEPAKDEDDSLRVLVDQKELKYTVGPYVLNFKNQNEGCVSGTGSEIMKDLVYNEIMGRNQGWSEENKFCTGKVEALITYEDGTHELTEVGVELLDASGNVMVDKFPKFGETFYLRYKTTLDDEIRYIRPSIEIKHLKKLTDNGNKYQVYTYKSRELKFSMLTDLGGLFEEALNRIGIGYTISKKAVSIDDYWEIWFNNRFKITSWDGPHILEEELNKELMKLWAKIIEAIKEAGADWGLGEIAVTPDFEPGIFWNNQYFPNPGCHIESKLFSNRWLVQTKDEETGELDEGEEVESLEKPEGDKVTFIEPIYEAKIEELLPGMSDWREYGPSKMDAEEALQGTIESHGRNYSYGI